MALFSPSLCRSVSLYKSFSCFLFPVFKLCACVFSSNWKITGRSLFFSPLFVVFVDILLHFHCPHKPTHTHESTLTVVLICILMWLFFKVFLFLPLLVSVLHLICLFWKVSRDTVTLKLYLSVALAYTFVFIYDPLFSA